MAAAKDILQDTDGDLLFKDGDFVIGLSDNQHITDIIISTPGSWKEYPLCGVGIEYYLNSSGTQGILKRDIQVQLTTDGYRVDNIQFETDAIDTFTVDAIRS